MASGQGMAILAGLLHGLGGIGAVETQRRERERQAAEKDADRRARENERFTSLPITMLPTAVRGAYTPDAGGNARVLLAELPWLQALVDKEEAQRNRAALYPDEGAGGAPGPGDVRRPAAAVDPYAGITSSEQLATHTGFQSETPANQLAIFNRLNLEGRFTDTGRAPAQGEGDTDAATFEAWLKSPAGQEITRTANAGVMAGNLPDATEWIERAYRQTHPLPQPVAAAATATPAPMPTQDQLAARAVMASLNRQARLGEITGAQHAEQMGKLREGERPKYASHIIETDEGQFGTSFNPLTGTYAPATRIGGPKPRTPAAFDKQMSIFDESLRVSGVDPASDLGKLARANYAKSAMLIPEGAVSVASADAALAMARAQLAQARSSGVTPAAPGAPTGPSAGWGTIPAAPAVATPSSVIKGNPKPVEWTTAQGLGMMEQTRVAAGRIKEALKDPDIDSYLGPYDQARSTIKRWTPTGLLGEVPPAVVDLEQNLSTLKNYTIRLLTGAQMNKEEVPRIIGSIVDQRFRGPEFRQRLETTLQNIRMLEVRVMDLALRGDQKARMVAEEVGLIAPQQGMPGAAPSAPSTAPPTPRVERWERDAAGNIRPRP